MSFDLLAQAIFGTGVDATLRLALVAAVAGFGLWMSRPRRAVTPLAVWTLVLAGAYVLPVVVAFAPAIPIVTSVQGVGLTANTLDFAVTAPQSVRLAVLAPAPGGAPLVAPSGEVPAGRAPAWTTTALLAYAIVALVLLAQIVSGWRLTLRVRRRARSIEDEDRVRVAVARIAPVEALPSCVIAESDAVRVPMALGLVRPAVLLPACWRGWRDDDLDAVLAHELSHVARYDSWRQLAALAYRAIFWPSPLAWWLRRALLEAGERASDEAVLDAGADQTRYAELLLGFFQQAARGRDRADWSLAMASGGKAQTRVHRILSWTKPHGTRSPVRVACGCAAVVILTLPVLVLAAAGRPTATTMPPAVAVAWPAPVGPVPRAETAAPRPAPVSRGSEPSAVAPSGPSTPSQATSATSAASVPDQNLAASLNALAPGHRIVLLFDLAGFSPEGLSTDVATAARYVDTISRRTEVGLDTVHTWSVMTLGAQLDTLAPFTTDTQTIREALDRVSAPRPASPASPRVQTIGTFCDSLGMSRATSAEMQQEMAVIDAIGHASRPLTDTKTVLYFAGPSVVTSASALMLALTGPCQTNGVTLLPVMPRAAASGGGAAVSYSQRPAASAAISFSIVQNPTSPVKLQSTLSTLEFGYAKATVRNTSAKIVTSITLSATLHPVDATLPVLTLTRAGPATLIAPDASAEIASMLIDSEAERPYLVKGATATIAVIEVAFADGSVWKAGSRP